MACPVLGYHNSCEDRVQLEDTAGGSELLQSCEVSDNGTVITPTVYRYGCTCNTASADDTDAMLFVIHYTFFLDAYPTDSELETYENETVWSFVDMEQYMSEVLYMQLNHP